VPVSAEDEFVHGGVDEQRVFVVLVVVGAVRLVAALARDFVESLQKNFV
jgi:hypothetical protein